MRQVTRRQVLSTGIVMAAGAALNRSLRAAGGGQEKVVLALIGAGGRGAALATQLAALPGVEFRSVCDVETRRAGALAEQLGKAQRREVEVIGDMRRVLDWGDVDAVVCALPEHWHALATIWACQAGKDVYVEKNLATTIWEGRQMIEAARRYKRIVQVGFQNRSAPYGQSARQYIQSGKLGKVVHVKVFNMLDGRPWQPQPDSPVPEGLDWDRWLGPAALVPYNGNRHRKWYYWYDYCGGTFGGDASHQLDLARMVLGDPAGPTAVYTAAGNFAYGSACPTPEMMAITYEYSDFIMTCESSNFPPYMRKSNNEERNGTRFPYWPQNNERIEIYGTRQMMYVGRHGVGWQVFEGDGKLVAQEHGVHPDRYHLPNFLDCIRTRRQPNAEIEQAQRSSVLIHLGNIAHRVGNQRLLYDAAGERFTDSEAANALLRPPMRPPYVIPERV